MPLSKIDSDSLNSPITAVNLAYTGTLTGGTGVVNLGSGQVYKDASGNVGVGTSSPATRLHVSSTVANATVARFEGAYTAGNAVTLASFVRAGAAVEGVIRYREPVDTIDFGTSTNHPVAFLTNNTERARIDSSGNLLVGKTSSGSTGQGSVFFPSAAWQSSVNGTAFAYHALFYRNADSTPAAVGAITSTSTTTTYSTSSDYRLKEAIAPMTGALAKVALLKPVTYKWKVDGSDGQGFIAHELAEVEAGCVTGEKDAVDAEGNPQYQGIDTSFLVATLTAAIQELKALVDTQAARITALETA